MYLPNSGKNNANKRSMLPSGSFVFWKWNKQAVRALILNRLVTRVNSKGNIPVSIIVDELPTLYFHKIDRLIGYGTKQ